MQTSHPLFSLNVPQCTNRATEICEVFDKHIGTCGGQLFPVGRSIEKTGISVGLCLCSEQICGWVRRCCQRCGDRTSSSLTGRTESARSSRGRRRLSPAQRGRKPAPSRGSRYLRAPPPRGDVGCLGRGRSRPRNEALEAGTLGTNFPPAVAGGREERRPP